VTRRAVVAAADADRGAHRLRTALAIRLLLHNALRVDEVCAADLADLGSDRGHRVLGIVGKGNRKSQGPVDAEHAGRAGGLPGRARNPRRRSGRSAGRTTAGHPHRGRMNQGHLWELVRRLARAAGVTAWKELSPHSLRHSAVTFALDAGVALRDVQDYARHRDPRTTRRYDQYRASLDRSAAYTVATYLA
jgi:integrase/recombinase XerD